MIHHIDLGVELRRTVCDLYSDLVTRPTGAAVRSGIERQLDEMGDRTLTVIDFSHVGLLDFSCADEIVAKLLLRAGAGSAGAGAYFIFRGISEVHLDAIEAVLERHGLALIAEDGGTLRLVGVLDERERQAWSTVRRLGRARADDLVREHGLGAEQSAELLDALCRRRLVMRSDEGYVAVGSIRVAEPSPAEQ